MPIAPFVHSKASAIRKVMYRGAAKERPATAEELFHKLFSNVSRLFDLIGVNPLDPDFGPNRRMICTWIAFLVAVANVTFFLWKQRSDMVEFLMVVPYVSFVIQALHMMIKAMVNYSNYRLLYAKLKQILDMLNENSTSRKLMAESLQTGTVLQGLLAVLYTVSVIFILAVPFFIWCISGDKIFLIMYRLPAIDENTTLGFLETMTMHVAILLASFCGFVGIDCFFLALIIPIIAFVDGIENEIHELNQLLDLEEASPIQSKLNRIVQLHQLLIEYELMLEDIYNFVMLVKVGTIVIGIISAILTIFTNQDKMAFVFAILLLVQLTQYCMLGTVISSKVTIKFSLNHKLEPCSLSRRTIS